MDADARVPLSHRGNDGFSRVFAVVVDYNHLVVEPLALEHVDDAFHRLADRALLVLSRHHHRELHPVRHRGGDAIGSQRICEATQQLFASAHLLLQLKSYAMLMTVAAPGENWTDERLDDSFGRIDKDFRELRAEMNARFNSIDARFDA